MLRIWLGATTFVLCTAGMSFSQIKPSLECDQECAAFQAGYAWAEEHDIGDEELCGGAQTNIKAGCRAYVEGHRVSRLPA